MSTVNISSLAEIDPAKYEPMPGHALFERDEEKAVNRIGLYIPETHRKPGRTGTVVAIKQKRDDPSPVQAGDRCIVHGWGRPTFAFKHEGRLFETILIDDIMCILGEQHGNA